LQRLYAFVVSLAITAPLYRLVDGWLSDDASKHPESASWLMFGSLIVTIVPFFHGANRHFDATYVTGEHQAKSGALMIDFIMLFFEGLLLFVAAMSVGKAAHFYTLLSGLLVYDAVWVGFTRLFVTDAAQKYWPWALVNLIAAAAILVSVWSNLLGNAFWSNEPACNIAVFLIVVCRTVFDYYMAWDFYYPTA
jgi:hypothetical protein